MTDSETIRLYKKQNRALLIIMASEALAGIGIIFIPNLHIYFIIQATLIIIVLCYLMRMKNTYYLSVETTNEELRNILTKQQILLEKQNDTIEMQKSHLDELRLHKLPFPFNGVR